MTDTAEYYVSQIDPRTGREDVEMRVPVKDARAAYRAKEFFESTDKRTKYVVVVIDDSPVVTCPTCRRPFP